MRFLSSGRGYAATAVKEVETDVEADEFFVQEPVSAEATEASSAASEFSSSPQSTRSSPPTTPPSSEYSSRENELAVDKPAGVSFATLKGRINYDTLKALTVKPFKLESMSEVQKRVLALMPGLTASKLKGQAREEVEARGEDAEQAEKGAGRSDLLVKAKTGTGKTLVRSHVL